MVFDISVIMTVRNGSNFIKRSVDSILNQTFPPKEVVIVDDGSTDETCMLIESIALKSCIPINLIRTSGIGRSKALNLAVKSCSYEWIANLDVDDYWLPGKLEKQIEIISNLPDAKIVITQSYLLYEGEKHVFIDSGINNKQLGYKKFDRSEFYAKNPVNHSSIMFSKGLFDFVGGYNEGLKKQIDYDLWVRFILVPEVFYQVNAPLTVKYLHGKQSFESRNVISYRLNSFFMKVFALVKLKAPWYFYFKAMALFFIGFIPSRLKKNLRKFTAS